MTQVGTQSATIYANLRRRLISAEFESGQRLKPDDLRKDYICSASTIRENLFRLSCDGFLDFVDQKGFRVPQVSEVKLRELAELRILLEQQGIRESISKANLDWESKLSAAHHRLRHIESQMKNIKNVAEHVVIWTKAERAFHETLVEGSGSDLLKQTHRNIFDRFRQMLVINYGRVQFGYRTENIEEHGAIVQAVIDRDADKCCTAISEHILKGIGAMRYSFAATATSVNEREQ